MACDKAISEGSSYEILACCLYEALERLAPGATDYVEWNDLPEWNRDLYRNAVERLLVERDVILDLLIRDMLTDKPKDAGAPAIEVTPEMIEAGTRTLWDSGVVETPIDGVDQMVVQKIFVAMALVSKERS